MTKVVFATECEGKKEVWAVDVTKLPGPVIAKLLMAALGVSITYGNCDVTTTDEASFDELQSAIDLVESYCTRVTGEGDA